jgi:ribose 1,5-bisphosphokinase
MTSAGARLGVLVLVVGPSGAGKDTVIDRARSALAHEDRFAFARRCITRRADAGGEDFESLTEREFAAADVSGEFALRWSAHGLSYGIRRAAVDPAIAGGVVVVANVSRSMIEPARRAYSRVSVVLVTAPPEVLAARLAARGREGVADIRRRLLRAGAMDSVECDFTIRNDRAIGEAVDAFVARLREVAGP